MRSILSAVKRLVAPPSQRCHFRQELADQFLQTAPSPTNALGIFQGQWVSRMPEPLQDFPAGSVGLFDDGRLHWLDEQLGGVQGLKILELGPLEAGHTYWLEKQGADAIVAVEANTRAFLKCLVIKEVFGLQRSRFLCGDILGYLQTGTDCFDLCLASGVLYHQTNPVEVLRLACQKAQSLFLWTHYYDEAIVSGNPALSSAFSRTEEAVVAGFRHRLHRYEYGASPGVVSFCGGNQPHSHWLDRADLLNGMHHVGFTRMTLAFDHPDHPHGPALGILARKE